MRFSLSNLRQTKLSLGSLSLAATCFAQVNTGRITGIVHDPSGCERAGSACSRNERRHRCRDHHRKPGDAEIISSTF